MTEALPITVLGASGWIGAALVGELQRQGQKVLPVLRAELLDWLAGNEQQGLVIYAIGLTSDFRQHPYATVESHVGLLSRVLQRRGLEDFLLLSSTRVYGRSLEAHETTPLSCLSTDPSDLYNLSKLLGEALVLQDQRQGLKVVRLSNVVGVGQPVSTFLGALLAEARSTRKVTILQPSNTQKDYVALSDVVRLLPLIARQGCHRLYNVGCGRNTSHAEVATWLERQGVNVTFGTAVAPAISFPTLLIKRLSQEFVPPGDVFSQTSLQLLMQNGPSV